MMKKNQGETFTEKKRRKIQSWIVLLLCTFVMVYVTYASYKFYEDFFETNYDYPFQDPTLPIDVRLDNLMSLLTQDEKVFEHVVVVSFCFNKYSCCDCRLICFGRVQQHQVGFKL